MRWPFLAVRPSTWRHGFDQKRPLAHQFASPPNGAGTARVLCFGDLMPMDGDRVPPCSDAVRELFNSADLVIGNCESPVVRSERRPDVRYFFEFDFGADFVRDVLEAYGVRLDRCVLSVANNHTADQGPEGLLETLLRLQALGVTTVGARHTSELVATYKLGDAKLGVAGWSDWMNHERLTPEVDVWRPQQVESHSWRDTRKQLGLDCLIGTPHWDWEWRHFPHPDTVSLAQKLATEGFDLIAGHHPHVLQPVGWFERGADQTPTLCQFSLGNLTGRTAVWPHRLTAVIETTLVTQGEQRGRILGYRVHPLVILDKHPKPRLAALEEAPAPLRKKLKQRLSLLYA